MNNTLTTIIKSYIHICFIYLCLSNIVIPYQFTDYSATGHQPYLWFDLLELLDRSIIQHKHALYLAILHRNLLPAFRFQFIPPHFFKSSFGTFEVFLSRIYPIISFFDFFCISFGIEHFNSLLTLTRSSFVNFFR